MTRTIRWYNLDKTFPYYRPYGYVCFGNCRQHRKWFVKEERHERKMNRLNKKDLIKNEINRR